ncbi:MAG: carboxymuconolactone decarboxylase family protein [Candidatus Nanohaloarchaea archaeon]
MSNPIDDEHRHAAGEFKEASGGMGEKYQDWQQEIKDESVFDDVTTELIMLSAAAAAQCKFCVHSHGQKAIRHGASKEEVAQVVQMAAEVKAGATISYGLEALEHFED